jgi:LPXTG-motif cell wall-anchored protein
VAPPKRKTGGRTTPKGGTTRPSERPLTNPDENAAGVHSSARYTPPVPKDMRESPPWLPALMLALLVLGAIIIMARNLVFSGNNWLTLLGLACILGGLFTATKWR